MTLPPDSLLPVAFAAALLTSILCAHATAQQPGDAAAQDLLTRIDARRVPAAKARTQTLAIDGAYTVTFANAPDQVVARGAFRDIFSGADLARQTSDMGDFGKMEKGVRGDVVWEVDPSMGAKVHRGAVGANVHRYFAWLRGAAIGELYRDATRTGTETIGDRECTVWKLTPKNGTPDLVYVDAVGSVQRIDMDLPTPESADATFGLDDSMSACITFSDWTSVDGVPCAKQRTMRMGPATVAFTVADIRVGTPIEPASFALPPAIEKAKQEPGHAPAFDADGKPNYQIVEREAQPVASIRVKCKPSEISQQLTIMLPEVMAHLTAIGSTAAGAPFTRYHSVSDTEIDLEAGIPVHRPITATDRIQNRELPAGKAVTVWHVGSYEKLSAVHKALQEHLTSHQLKPRGAVWEVYWTDPGMVPDPAKWRTQVFAPIE